MELLRRRAEVDGHQALQQVTPELRAKVRALTAATGGSPRLVVALYEILTPQATIETLLPSRGWWIASRRTSSRGSENYLPSSGR